MDKDYWKIREQNPKRKEYQRKRRLKRKKENNQYMKEYRQTKKYKNWVRTSGYYKKKWERIRDKRKKLVEYFGGKCVQCGYDKCYEALEFHHKDSRDKENTWRKDVSFEKMIKEAKKCKLLCANCHREEHVKNKDFGK